MDIKKDGYCACNCGGSVSLYRGKYRKFVKGHQARGEFNSRFGINSSKETKEKISESQKQRLEKSNPWIGRKHSQESKIKMSQTRKEIFIGEGNPFYGKHHSEETKNKIRLGNAKYRANYSHVVPSKPELLVHQALKSRQIDFQTEFVVGVFCVDVLIPVKKLILFVDGCYWHACPIHHPNNKKRQSDASRVNFLKACGYDVEIIWEHDIENNIEKVIEEICKKYKLNT